jgi:hypothetical protein
VILEKDIVTSLTKTHSKTNGWNAEISEEFSVETMVSAEAFGIGSSITASASSSETNGKSKSLSDENSRSTEVSKNFQFELEAPPCTKITGRVR